MIATPNGPPTFWTACITADPTPLRSGDSADSAVAAAVDIVRPVPAPTRIVQRATNPPPDVTVVVAPSAIPAASSANPAAIAARRPTRAAIRSAGSAPATS